MSCRVRMVEMPRLRSVRYVSAPTMGIFRTESGPRKCRSVPRLTCRSLLGLASPVATLATVLLVLNPSEMGSPVSRITRSRSSRENCQHPKNRSSPVRSA